jgi:hypothetical protein
MSALPPKADVNGQGAGGPLLTRSGPLEASNRNNAMRCQIHDVKRHLSIFDDYQRCCSLLREAGLDKIIDNPSFD